MTQQVEDENGQTHEFPDDATPDEMNSAIDSSQADMSIAANKSQSSNNAPADTNSDMSFLQKLPRNIVAGLAEGGHDVLNLPSNIAQWSEKHGGDFLGLPASKIPRQQDYDYSALVGLPKEETLSDKLIKGLVKNLPGLIAPEAELGEAGEAIKAIPYAGRFLKKAIGSALPTGAYTAIQNPEDAGTAGGEAAATTVPFSAASTLLATTNPYARMAARMGLSAVGGYGAHKAAEELGASPTGADTAALAGATLGMVGQNPQQLAKENMLKGVENTPALQEKLAAGNRLGLTYLTPAEVSGNPVTAAQQGGAGKTDEGSQILYNQGQQRMDSEKKAIEDFKSTISPASSDASFAIRDAAQQHLEDLKGLRSAAASPFYKEAEDQEIPQNELDTLLKTPRIKSTFFHILDDPDYKDYLQGSPPTGSKMISMIQNRIDNLISDAKEKPYNSDRVDQLNFAKKNLTSDYDHPQVQNVLDDIYKKDPVFKATVYGINPRSVKFLDAVKQKIDTDSSNLASKVNPAGRDLFKSKLINNASQQIRDTTDKYIEPYRKARNIFQDMSPVVDDATKSTLGQLANLKDSQLKNASQTIFDPAQTNLNVLRNVKNSIMRKNPEAWDAITRNEIERLNKNTNGSGTSFYRTTLQNPALYNQLKLALDHNPEASQKLEDMKLTFKDLINPPSQRTAAGLANTGMRQNRNSLVDFATSIKNKLSGDKYDKAAVGLITNPKWLDKLNELAKAGNFRNRLGNYTDLLGRAAGVSVGNQDYKPTAGVSQ